MLLRSISVLFTILFSLNAWSYPARFSVSPDNSQQLLTETLKSARSEIVMNIYMITSFRLNNILLAKMKDGVTVKVLVEAEPFGGKIVPPQKKILDELSKAINASSNPNNQLLIMSSQNGKVKRRFNFNHAKYVVIDGNSSYVSSENFVGSGTMSSPDRKGNRGWQVVLEDKTLAKKLLKYFSEDTNPKNKDAVPYDPSFVKVIETPLPPRNSDNSRDLTPITLGAGDVDSAEICASPQALRCMLPFMQEAKNTLDIQHLSLPLYWPGKNGKVLNPILVEAISAAKRGVKVRVLMNPSDAFGDDDKDDRVDAGAPPPYNSDETKAYLQQVAKEQRLPLEAGIMNIQELQLYAVHNKGMLADGKKAWVGSINGTENSVSSNREIAVDINSQDAAKYYGEVFSLDWSKATH